MRDCPNCRFPTRELVEIARSADRVVYGCPACLREARRVTAARWPYAPGGPLWW
jgi:hypothetical protein